MKTKFFLLLCLLLLTIKCEGDGQTQGDGSGPSEEDIIRRLCNEDADKEKSKEDCINVYNTSISEKYDYYCCYIAGKIKEDSKEQEIKTCQRLHKADLDDLETWKKNFLADVDDGTEVLNFEIYCDEKHSTSYSSSAFLKLGLVSLFAALLI